MNLLKKLAVVVVALSPMASNADLIYETNFPSSPFSGPCSPCGSFTRVFDRVSLGAAYDLTRIEFAVHDVTEYGRIQDISISIFDNTEAVLFGMAFSGASLEKFDFITGRNYIIGIDLPSWSVADEPMWISIFGLSGSRFGLFRGGGGDGVACQNRSSRGFVNSCYNSHNDISMRLFAASVSEPSTFALFGLGLLGMGLTRRRKKPA